MDLSPIYRSTVQQTLNAAAAVGMFDHCSIDHTSLWTRAPTLLIMGISAVEPQAIIHLSLILWIGDNCLPVHITFLWIQLILALKGLYTTDNSFIWDLTPPGKLLLLTDLHPEVVATREMSGQMQQMLTLHFQWHVLNVNLKFAALCCTCSITWLLRQLEFAIIVATHSDS